MIYIMSNISNINFYLSDNFSWSGSNPPPFKNVDDEQGWQYYNTQIGQQLKALVFDGSNVSIKYNNISSVGIQFRCYQNC